MAITIQLTEIPLNETVANRVFTLDRNGGDFGSSFECAIQLPDRSGQVGHVHGRFVASKHHMNIEAVNGHKISLNGTVLASGRMATIEDGSVIQIADYVMLVSQIDSIESDQEDPVVESSADVHFTLSDLHANDDEDIVMKNDRQDSLESYQKEQQQKPHFAASGVFSDDPFADDPFQDDEISLKQPELNQQSSFESNTVETLSHAEVESELIFEEQPARQSSLSATTGSDKSENIDKLVSLLGEQITSANEQQANLLKAIDKTLTTFLEEFSPQHLEEIYEDFAVPFFVQKEKQYWLTNRKTFNRRLKKGEYHRLFKALLIENMQNKD